MTIPKPPAWAEKLIIKELERIKEQSEEAAGCLSVHFLWAPAPCGNVDMYLHFIHADLDAVFVYVISQYILLNF